MPGRSTETYQEGLIIPPLRLYVRGELQSDVIRLILANVRTPTERRGDLNAHLARRRRRSLVEIHNRERGECQCRNPRCNPRQP